MSEISRENHVNFTKYQEFIVNHKNYNGLHFKRKIDKSISWVAPKVTKDGKLRDIWWRKKAEDLGIQLVAGFYVKVAVLIHPTKKHVCQICGKSLSIYYVYPNRNLLKRIDEIFFQSYQPFEKDIFEIIDDIPFDLNRWKTIFKAEKLAEIINIDNLKNWLQVNHVNKSKKSFLSPGVMSNAPDRFDGFHSDGNCCRSKSDKGRHKENLQRYGQDRRVYENWADGDWKQADRLMSMYRKFNLSADHIGPISLGFCHRPKFAPLTKEENSAKNNRMSFSDIQILITDEEKGEQVISWHSKYIWDSLKNQVTNDIEAVKLSAMMRTNLHWVLTLFAKIDKKGYKDFLMQFLNLEYSDYDYEFPEFKPDKVGKIIRISKNGRNQDNNKERYVRIAFESLKKYRNIDNRRVSEWDNSQIDGQIEQLFTKLNANDNKKALKQLHLILQSLANQLTQLWESDADILSDD